VRDTYGTPLHVQSIIRDISSRKQAETELRTSEARFRSLFEQTNDAVFILDLNGKHQTANQRAADMLGYSLEELLNLSVREISAEVDKSSNVLEIIMTGTRVPPYERVFRKKDGQLLPVEISVELVRDTQGQPSHIQSVVRDISKRKQQEEQLKKANEQLNFRIAEVERLHAELREQAMRDPLTQLHNRHYLNETIHREMLRIQREKLPLSVIILDVDYFKRINDTHGHAAGDKVLIGLAGLISNHMRGSDIICRYGGEEFIAVLPGATLRDAEKRAEELRTLCQNTVFRHNRKKLKITVSLGLAAYPEHGNTVEEVIIKADKALYQSKHNGRNQISTYNKNITWNPTDFDPLQPIRFKGS
jgi:diguanylate cyclase (GGDEF)-like protein/PAS domain S-box-containing protein